jgi:hypothetical protein
MNNYKSLNVSMFDRKVGTLAVTPKYLVAFEYDNDWIAGYPISNGWVFRWCKTKSILPDRW